MTEKLQATVEHAGDSSVVTLAGFLDEDNNLKSLIDQIPAGTAMIDLAGIARINSCGIRDWVNWLAALEANGTKPVLVGCSPPVVAQINLVKNFAGNGAVKSFQVPYHCGECDEEKIVLVETQDMSSPSAPSCPCPRCGHDMALDEMPESYFAFLAMPAAHHELARGSSAAVVKSRVKTRERRSEPPARRSQPSLSAYQTPAMGIKRPSSSSLLGKRPSRPSQPSLALGSNERISGERISSPRISGTMIDPSGRDSSPAPAPAASNALLWVTLVAVLLAGIGGLGYFVLVQ